MGRSRERERERTPSRLCAVSTEPDGRLEPTKPWDHALSQNQESDAQPTEPPRHPYIHKLKKKV